MKAKRLWGVMIMVICSMGLIYRYHRNSSVVLDPGARMTFVGQPLFRSPLRSNRRYSGTIKGTLDLMSEAQVGQSTAIDGALGFGGNSGQMFLHYNGYLGGYNLNTDRLKESDQYYVRSSNMLISGAVANDFLRSLLGSLSNTNGQYVHLNGFASRDWFHYVLDPKNLFQILSGALLFDYQNCEGDSRCPVLIDTDFLSPASVLSNDPVMAFFQELHTQEMRFYPKEGLLSVDVLQSRLSSVSGKIGKNALELMRNNHGIINEVIIIKHELDNNHHTVWLDMEQDGELGQSWKIEYDVYPDGLDIRIDSLLSGKTLNLKGNRYDAGAFVPVDKGQPLDIYGLLGTS